MANQNYDQVPQLYAQGKLSWTQDAILAVLVTDGVFDAAQKTVAELVGSRRATAPIPGRFMGPDGAAMGLPVTFPKAGSGIEYQVVLVKDTGNNDPLLLAYVDADMNDNPITILRSGTLIVRPVLPAEPPVPPDNVVLPPTTGVWMNLTT